MADQRTGHDLLRGNTDGVVRDAEQHDRIARTVIATAVRPGRRDTARSQRRNDRRTQPAGPHDRQRLRERGRAQR